MTTYRVAPAFRCNAPGKAFAGVHLEDLTAEQRKQLGVPTPRKTKFSAESMRSWALKALAAMAALSRAERERVLRHALKINRV